MLFNSFRRYMCVEMCILIT